MTRSKMFLSLLLIALLIGCANTKDDSEKIQGLNGDNQVPSKTSSSSVKPVDANGDGVIDHGDIVVLGRKGDELKMRGNALIKKSEFTPAEEAELEQLTKELELVTKQLDATLKGISP